MGNHNPTIWLICLVLTLVPVVRAQSAAQAATPETWSGHAALVPTTSRTDAVRSERSEVFNSKNTNARKLDSPKQSDGQAQGSFPPYFVRIAAIPTQESNTIVLGTVNSVAPFFSADHTHLYTEFTVSIESVMKDSSGVAKDGGTIAVDVRGGRATLANGRTVEDRMFKNFLLASGGRYVLFLRYVRQGAFFTVIKSWELKNGAAVPTSHEDLLDAEAGKSRYAGMPESNFLKAVRQAAGSGQGQQ